MTVTAVDVSKWAQGLQIPLIPLEPSPDRFRKVSAIRTVGDFRAHLEGLGIPLEVDDEIHTRAQGSPLGACFRIGDRDVRNRGVHHPMEGWDGTRDGKPTDRVRRRWEHYGESDVGIVWGCEATAVREDGRANPCQLMISEFHREGLRELLQVLMRGWESVESRDPNRPPLVGLQLTHSGRWAKPNHNAKFEPVVAYEHPCLNNNTTPITDREVEELIQLYVKAARIAHEIGFDFVDIKACHGYLGHEFLSAFTREGPFGGESLENRSRFIREIICRIRQEVPDLMVGVRLSAFDTVPFKPDPAVLNRGRAIELGLDVRYPAFGVDPEDPTKVDLTEPIALINMLVNDLALHVNLLNITAGSPYYNAHIQRPAEKAPIGFGSYEAPEDPLNSAYRQILATSILQAHFPNVPMVGTAYTIFQDYFPHVAQAIVRQAIAGQGGAHFVGLGRGLLSYWNLFTDCLENGKLDRGRICRTLSWCTTAPRRTDADSNPGPSGCYPFDPFFHESFADLRHAVK